MVLEELGHDTEGSVETEQVRDRVCRATAFIFGCIIYSFIPTVNTWGERWMVHLQAV